MTNVDCHFYVEVFESEEDKDPIAISNIFKFPDDNPDSQVHTDAMDKYIEGMSDGLGVLPLHYRVFRVRGDGVKKFQYAGAIIADEEETEDKVAAVTDSQDEEETEVADAKSGDEAEEPEQEPEQEDETESESEKEPEREDETEEDEVEEPEQEDETESEKADEQEDETEEEPEQEDETESEKADKVQEGESKENEEDDWPWLTELEGQPASKKNANKFMLGALMNYWMKPETSWDNAEKLAEDILEDPDDLWGIIADKSDADIKALFTGPPRLHRFLKMVPEMVHEIAINVVKEYDGDSRKIWKDQDVSDILQRLHDIGVKKQTSSLIIWALKESGQIEA